MIDWEASIEWKTARKKPVDVEVAGPFRETATIETLEGEFDIGEEYLSEHDGFYLIRGVEGEIYPCAIGVFEQTYEVKE